MPLQNLASPDPHLDQRARAAADRYLKAVRDLKDRSYWPVRMFTALNVFLWHLDGFSNGHDPIPQFVDVFNRAADFLTAAARSGVSGGHFPNENAATLDAPAFEKSISTLFSDVWVGLTDDIYFDQSYEFTKERFALNGFDAEAVFRGKVVVDAGCGSGKFSAALARLGAAKVIGLDIGEKGLDFARAQAKKVPYGGKLDYRRASLLDIPLPNDSVDFVWSNGVIHHTVGYEKCLEEFHRILKPGGEMFLYVDGRFGLFELLCDVMVEANADLPRSLFQHYLATLGMNSGRIYWIMDCLHAPYERKSVEEVEKLLRKYGFTDLRQMKRGLEIDQIEHVSQGRPYAEICYGEAQLRYLARKA